MAVLRGHFTRGTVPWIFRLFWRLKKKTLIKSSYRHNKNTRQIFLHKKNPEIENFKPKTESFDHPRALKTGIPHPVPAPVLPGTPSYRRGNRVRYFMRQSFPLHENILGVQMLLKVNITFFIREMVLEHQQAGIKPRSQTVKHAMSCLQRFPMMISEQNSLSVA